MALVLNDRVKETTTTTGTDAIVLGGAATGFEHTMLLFMKVLMSGKLVLAH